MAQTACYWTKMPTYKVVNPQLHSIIGVSHAHFMDFLALYTSSFIIVNIHQLLNTVMTLKIPKYLCYVFPPALSLSEWVVIKHMYMLSMSALCLQCSCIGYLQKKRKKKTSEDVLRSSNGSVRDASYHNILPISVWGSTSLYEATARNCFQIIFSFHLWKDKEWFGSETFKNVRFAHKYVVALYL